MADSKTKRGPAPKPAGKKFSAWFRFKLSAAGRAALAEQAKAHGFTDISGYIRAVLTTERAFSKVASLPPFDYNADA